MRLLVDRVGPSLYLCYYTRIQLEDGWIRRVYVRHQPDWHNSFEHLVRRHCSYIGLLWIQYPVYMTFMQSV